MFGWLSAASVCASRVKRASRSGSRAKSSGRTLIATSRLSLRVAGAIDLAHAAGADGGEDLVGAEARARGQRHGLKACPNVRAGLSATAFSSADSTDYLTATIMKSTGLLPVFFDSCATPRPMNCTSPRFQVVFAGLPSIASDIVAGPSAITTWSNSCFEPAGSVNVGSAVAR